MITVLLIVAAWFAQGILVAPNQSGTVLGTLRTSAGTPAAGVRVSALAKPEATYDLATSNSLAGIAETDAAGRFRLENVPPGRYYIVAGNIDIPTFYPGTISATEGKDILITPGLTVSGIDFALNSASAGRANSLLQPLGIPPRPSYAIPVRTRIEGGEGKIPMFSDGWFPLLRLARTNSLPVESSLAASTMIVPETEYTATVQNLPDTYVLKSFTFGLVDLKTNVLQLAPVMPAQATATNLGSVIPINQAISIVLEYRPRPQANGVRVSGRIGQTPNRSIYLSGMPGTLYADGSFEFSGVSSGRHAIVTLNNPVRERPLGASLVVGNRDMPNVELEEVSIAPYSGGLVETPAQLPANLVPNAKVPLAAARGRVKDAITGEPFDAGRVVVNNDHAISIPLETGGVFQIPKLLPGTYTLEVAAFGIGVVTRTIVVEDKDVVVEVAIPAEQ